MLAPFNMIVKNKRVDVGDMVGTNTALIELIGSDTLWVKLAVPQNDLRWIDIPDPPGLAGIPRPRVRRNR